MDLMGLMFRRKAGSRRKDHASVQWSDLTMRSEEKEDWTSNRLRILLNNAISNGSTFFDFCTISRTEPGCLHLLQHF